MADLMGGLNGLRGVIGSRIEGDISNYFDGSWQVVDAKTGQNIVNFTSFLDANILRENQVVDEDIEEGSFASYNKVEAPLEVKITLGIEGTTAELQSALVSLDKYVKGIDLINCVTPTAEYRNLNLERYDYDLKADIGRGVLYVSLFLLEIRQVRSEYTNVKIPEQQNRGTVQGKKVDTSKSTKKNSAPNRSMLKSLGDAVRSTGFF